MALMGIYADPKSSRTFVWSSTTRLLGLGLWYLVCTAAEHLRVAVIHSGKWHQPVDGFRFQWGSNILNIYKTYIQTPISYPRLDAPIVDISADVNFRHFIWSDSEDDSYHQVMDMLCSGHLGWAATSSHHTFMHGWTIDKRAFSWLKVASRAFTFKTLLTNTMLNG